MKKLLLTGIAVLFVLSAFADWRVRSREGDSIVLTERPCPMEIASAIKPQYRDQFFFAFAMLGGSAMEVCWIRDGDMVFVWVDDEVGFSVPWDRFKVDTGI